MRDLFIFCNEKKACQGPHKKKPFITETFSFLFMFTHYVFRAPGSANCSIIYSFF